MRSWVDLTLMTLTFVFSIVWNVEVGIVVSIIISLLLVVRRSSKTRLAILVRNDPHDSCSYDIGFIMHHRGGYLGRIDGNQSTSSETHRKMCLACLSSASAKALISVCLLTLSLCLMLTHALKQIPHSSKVRTTDTSIFCLND